MSGASTKLLTLFHEIYPRGLVGAGIIYFLHKGFFLNSRMMENSLNLFQFR